MLWKMTGLTGKRLSLSEKYKAEKYGVSSNTISTWMLHGNKEKLTVPFNLVRLAQKGKTEWEFREITIWLV